MVPWTPARQALQAIIINICPSDIPFIAQMPYYLALVGRCADKKAIELFDDPIVLAASLGRVRFLEAYFLDRRLSRKALRTQALGPAIRAGRLDILGLVLEPRWGLLDLVDNPISLEDMVQGMLRSPLVDFSTRVVASFESCGPSLVVSEPDINGLLDGIAFGSPQRADVAAWLISRGASVQARHPKTSVEESGWNPLRRAVMGGNEKIVRLLLERGADTNSTEMDILDEAVKRGRGDIVQLLMQHGAGRVVDAASEDGPRNPKTLMEHALASENAELVRCLSPLWDYA